MTFHFKEEKGRKVRPPTIILIIVKSIVFNLFGPSLLYAKTCSENNKLQQF